MLPSRIVLKNIQTTAESTPNGRSATITCQPSFSVCQDAYHLVLNWDHFGLVGVDYRLVGQNYHVGGRVACCRRDRHR